MERLIANTDGQVRRAFKDGREYLVAPLSLIVPGVLPGSQGPIYYPADEIAKDHQAWDNMPLLSYHPQAQNEQHVSANHVGIADKQQIGFVQKPYIDKLRKGSLRAEGWFDVEHMRSKDKRILESLENNKSIELSTGLFIERREAAPPGANANGTGYEWIGRGYKPDHVAILPDQLGACSIRDGCGVLVNQLVLNSANGNGTNNQSSATMKPGDRFEVVQLGSETLYRLVPAYNARGEGTPEPNVPKEAETKTPTEAKPNVQVKPPKVGSAQAAAEIHDYADRIKPSATKPPEPAMNELQAFLLYNARWDQGARDKLSKEAPDDFAGPHQSFPIRSQEDVDHAAKLIGHADNPEAVKSKVKGIAKRKELSVPDSWKEATNNTANPPTPNKEETVMNAEQQLKEMIANCQCQDEKAVLIVAHNKLAENAKKKADGKPVKSNIDGDADDGYSDVENDTDMHAFDGPKGSGKSIQAGGSGTKDEYPKATQNALQGIVGKLAGSNLTPQEVAIITNSLTAAHEQDRREKFAMAKRIVDNSNLVANESRRTLGKALLQRGLSELREMVAGIQTHNQQDQTPHYFGNNPPAFNGHNGAPGSVEVPVENNLMTPQTPDWKEWSESWHSGKQPANV